MSGLRDLERELVEAAARGAVRPQRSIVPLRSLLVAIGVLPVCVVLGIAISSGGGSSQHHAAAPGENLAGCRTAGSPTANYSNAAADPRILSALAILRHPASAADETPEALCAAASVASNFAAAHAQAVVHKAYVRLLGPGPFGGRMYVVPVSGNRLPESALLGRNAPTSPVITDPAVCITTMNADGPTSTINGCLTLPALQAGGGFFAVADDASSGSVLVGIFDDDIVGVRARVGANQSSEARVSNNYAVVHATANATVAAQARIEYVRRG
jgi:hypothetical protein